MSYHQFPAMGTVVEAWADEANGLVLRRWFEQVESSCSRFRSESDLSRVNADNSTIVPLGGVLLEVVEAASRAYQLTDGLVDIGVGRAVEAWGYDRTFEEVVDLDVAPADSGPSSWLMERGRLHRPPGVRLDLGGIAKGWACDRAVESGLASVVSAGGDMRSDDPDTTAPIFDPSGKMMTKLHVGIGSLATSSVGRRRWRVGNREVCHLIDSRTMKPVDTPVVSATVLAEHAVDAETGAKAVLLLGVDGLEWASRQHWIDAAMVLWHDGSIFGTPGIEVAA